MSAGVPHDKIIVIGAWDNDSICSIRLQNFVENGETFIPIFSNETVFRQQVEGSGFENAGLEIDRDLLFSILHGNELLVLDPGGPNPMMLRKADLARHGS